MDPSSHPIVLALGTAARKDPVRKNGAGVLPCGGAYWLHGPIGYDDPREQRPFARATATARGVWAAPTMAALSHPRSNMQPSAAND